MTPFLQITARNRSSFGVGAIVGVLGGLIGLGGAEFRLPLLVTWFRYSLLSAVLINLLVSLVTVVVSLGFRAQIQGLGTLLEQWPVALNILAGSLVGSYAGVHVATHISDRALVVTVAVILVFLGLLLIGNSWLFSHGPLVLDPAVRVIVGIFAGLLIGAVSSLLGVAGGELIIPTLILFFGLEIKLAGSVSLMISIPTIIVGIMRYRTRPVFREVSHELRFVLFMALGSGLGALVGSQLLPYAPSGMLKIFLGAILLVSAAKIARTRFYVPARKMNDARPLNQLDGTVSSNEWIIEAIRAYIARCDNVPDPPAYDLDEEGNLKPQEEKKEVFDYLDYSGRDDVISGGIKMVPVDTPKGTYNVWTKRVGNNLTTKMLLLHGGPGATHEYFEAFDSYFPVARIEYYYYDQLGSYYSDQPEEPELWELPRFVEEVEQVRQALGLDDFYLLGHSWGGLLATEYALKYQQHLKGLVISNMMSSIPAYNEYAQKTLMPAMDQNALAEIKSFEESGDHENPRYMELLIEHHYVHHVLRMPHAEWPDPVNRAFKHLNPAIYVPMQGPSELGASGKIASWDRTAELETISIPTLVIGGQHDTMDPSFMEMMSHRLPKGRYLHCAQGSHLAMYDDQKVYFDGLVQFLRDVAAVF